MNDRAIIPSAVPADIAERQSDNARVLSPAEQQSIRDRATEIISDRLDDGPWFCHLTDDLDIHSCEPYLHAIVRNARNARSGDQIARNNIVAAGLQFAAAVESEAELVWRESAMQEAEKELR